MEHSTRAKCYNLTINPNARCYSSNKEEIIALIHSSFVNCDYAFIYHNKEDGDNNNHIHLNLRFKNSIACSSIKKVFDGAHIEVAKSFKKCMQYLIHLGQEDKVAYTKEEIVSNLTSNMIEEQLQQFENDYLDEELLLECVDMGYTLRDFVKRFGMPIVNLYKNLIKDLILEKRNTESYDLQQHICDLRKELDNALEIVYALNKGE